MKITITSLCLFALIAALSCAKAEPEQATKGPLNPNGDSELALLMRAMFDDGMKVREQILKGEKPQVTVDFEKIHTATPSKPEMIEYAGFEEFALSYVEAMRALKAASAEEARPLYETAVAACLNCHNAGCGGPIVRIKKMLLPEK